MEEKKLPLILIGITIATILLFAVASFALDYFGSGTAQLLVEDDNLSFFIDGYEYKENYTIGADTTKINIPLKDGKHSLVVKQTELKKEVYSSDFKVSRDKTTEIKVVIPDKIQQEVIIQGDGPEPGWDHP